MMKKELIEKILKEKITDEEYEFAIQQFEANKKCANGATGNILAEIKFNRVPIWNLINTIEP